MTRGHFGSAGFDQLVTDSSGVDTPPVAILNYNRPVQFSSIDKSSWSSRTTSHNTIIRSACIAHTDVRCTAGSSTFYGDSDVIQH